MSQGLKLHNAWILAENAFYLSYDRWIRWSGKNFMQPQDANTVHFMFKQCEELLKKRELTKEAWKAYNDIYLSIQMIVDRAYGRAFNRRVVKCFCNSVIAIITPIPFIRHNSHTGANCINKSSLQI